MQKNLHKILHGYHKFRRKYAHGNQSIMRSLSDFGQKPAIMVVACCDSRVDPALILQCEPGDLFVVRNVANLVPPYEKDDKHHGTSAALEFAVKGLQIKHLILLGHSQCGGVKALISDVKEEGPENDFISSWMSLVKCNTLPLHDVDLCAQATLRKSYANCLTFPWIKQRMQAGELAIHLWFFNIQQGQILRYNHETHEYVADL